METYLSPTLVLKRTNLHNILYNGRYVKLFYSIIATLLTLKLSTQVISFHFQELFALCIIRRKIILLCAKRSET